MYKVTALITRSRPQGREILVFEHPHGGVQLPAGTVEPGEDTAAAAEREATEETALTDLPPGVLLGSHPEPLRRDHFLTKVTTPVYAAPDPTSYSWASIRYGIHVRRHRTAGDFSHVTYTDVYHRGGKDGRPFVTYRITGWVATADLTLTVTRFFYHFAYHGDTPETWFAESDNHRFRLFWVPLATDVPVTHSQRWWLEVLADVRESLPDASGVSPAQEVLRPDIERLPKNLDEAYGSVKPLSQHEDWDAMRRIAHEERAGEWAKRLGG
jgi:8-oxo-dGTP pyrophosphatase MutT (NUDIX family)